MKIFIYIAFSISFGIVRASENNIKEYYAHIHCAEHFAILGDYSNAVVQYQYASMLRRPFAVDVFNQLVCYLFLGNYNRVFENCKILAEKGAPASFFSQVLFQDFRKSTYYERLLSEYDNLHQIYLSHVDASLVGYIKKLVDADQNIHCLLPSTYNDTAFVNRMRANDNLLSSILSSLMISNDLLGEETIGANFYSDTCLSEAPLYSLIALHEIQRGSNKLDSVLYVAMKLGRVKPEVALQWLCQTNVAKIDLTRTYEIYNDTLWELQESEEERRLFEIDVRRSQVQHQYILSDFYLNDSCFDVKERVIYNFFRNVSITRTDHQFIILPEAFTSVITKKNSEKSQHYLRYLHTKFRPINFR